jgi:hypothetical protein
MAVYNTETEIVNAVDKEDRIEGVIRFDLGELIEGVSIEYFNYYMAEQLVGKDYYWALEGIGYSLVGCDTYTQEVLILVNADAKQMLLEMESSDNN